MVLFLFARSSGSEIRNSKSKDKKKKSKKHKRERWGFIISLDHPRPPPTTLPIPFSLNLTFFFINNKKSFRQLFFGAGTTRTNLSHGEYSVCMGRFLILTVCLYSSWKALQFFFLLLPLIKQTTWTIFFLFWNLTQFFSVHFCFPLKSIICYGIF